MASNAQEELFEIEAKKEEDIKEATLELPLPEAQPDDKPL